MLDSGLERATGKPTTKEVINNRLFNLTRSAGAVFAMWDATVTTVLPRIGKLAGLGGSNDTVDASSVGLPRLGEPKVVGDG